MVLAEQPELYGAVGTVGQYGPVRIREGGIGSDCLIGCYDWQLHGAICDLGQSVLPFVTRLLAFL